MSDSEELIDDLPDANDDAGDDLFGDGDGDDNLDEILSQSDRGGRALSDGDLASDHGDRRNDYDDEMREDDEPAHRDETIMSVPMYRHRIPKASDGQLRSFKVPSFLKFQPEEYKPDSFVPAPFDNKNALADNPVPVVRYRRDPATGKMQSNTNIYRWSDGSVTLAVGEDHYEIQTKSLAPAPGKPYSDIQDAHYYTAAAHLSSNCLLVVGHVTEQYSVRPNHAVQDDALERLQKKMQEATKAKADDLIIHTTEDPELAKKQAELAEKERNKAQRRRETAAAKMDGGSAGRYARGALSIGDLEGGRGRGAGAAGGRKRGAAGGGAKKRTRGAEYDSDDDLPGGAGRHDEYVLDDFAVASDEEGSEGEEDEEEEILDDEEEEEEDEAPRRKRQRTAEKEDEDADAEADMDDDEAPAPAARRRRRVVEDDEDDE